MALSNPVLSYGISDATIEDLVTKERFSLRVLGDIEFNSSQESNKLYGGASDYPWGIAKGVSEATLSMTVKQYDVSVLKYFSPFIASALVENTSGDTSGYVSSPLNVLGTSAVSATTGIASCAVTSTINPKFGSYYIKAVSSTTFNVYINNNLTGLILEDDNLKVNSTPYTLPNASTIALTEIGITLTGGSAVAMITGDIASFDVRPINSYNYSFKGGYAGSSLQNFALTVFAEKLGGNQYRSLFLPRVQASGMPIKFLEKDWSTFDVELDVAFDSSKGYAYEWQVVNR